MQRDKREQTRTHCNIDQIEEVNKMDRPWPFNYSDSWAINTLPPFFSSILSSTVSFSLFFSLSLSLSHLFSLLFPPTSFLPPTIFLLPLVPSMSFSFLPFNLPSVLSCLLVYLLLTYMLTCLLFYFFTFLLTH